MRIKIIASIHGSPDHVNLRFYDVGEVFEVGTADMPQFLAETLLREGYAVDVRIDTSHDENVPTPLSDAKRGIPEAQPAKVSGFPKKHQTKA